jgi:hypothetical protein
MTLVPQESIDWLVALLRDGRAYYRHAEEHTSDPEVRRAFEIAAETRSALLADLQAAGFSTPLFGNVDAPQDHSLVPAAHRYETLRLQFDPAHPEAQAAALLPREEATLKLMESVFRSNPAPAMRALMKKHYAPLQQGGAIVQRLAQRSHAA